MTDEEKLRELRIYRLKLCKSREQLDNQISTVNKQIDEIYFNDAGINRFLNHIIYYEDRVDDCQSFIFVKEIKRLTGGARFMGPAIVKHSNEDFYYENQETIDVYKTQFEALIIRDDLLSKFTETQNKINDIILKDFPEIS